MFVPEIGVVGAFVLASLALNLTPGLDMTYVVGATLRWRTRAGVCAALGIALGSLCHVVLAAAGLSALVAASPVLMNVVTFAGAAYLVWSGVAMIRDTSALPVAEPATAGGTPHYADHPRDDASPGAALPDGSASSGAMAATDERPGLLTVTARGALVNLLNVKVVVFYLSFIPQFVRAQDGPTWQQVAFFGVLFNVLGTSVLVAVALLTGLASRSVLSSPRALLRARLVCGVTLIVMAFVLSVSRLFAH
ncbi:LysE family translocator [Cellulomonas timonensis]|uniref:LysE family translocator n=1 Tax=Cellulomonas timonensis TaxID=1689271 RepID=UPI000ADC8926|nr:LysE family translocator [Cellulomonas timonensis]